MGARRADWVERTAKLLRPEVIYFQVVFTIPDTLSSLFLGNRRPWSGVEFMRCWALHILPKGFTKVRCYGGWSNTGRGGYLARCARLTPPVIETRSDPPPKTEPQTPTANTPSCPKCKTPTVLESSARRPSWRDLFYGPDTIDAPQTIAYVASG